MSKENDTYRYITSVRISLKQLSLTDEHWRCVKNIKNYIFDL